VCGNFGHADVSHCTVCGGLGHDSHVAHCELCVNVIKSGHSISPYEQTIHTKKEHICSICSQLGHEAGSTCKTYYRHLKNIKPHPICSICKGSHTIMEHECSTCHQPYHQCGITPCSWCNSLSHCSNKHICETCHKEGHPKSYHACAFCDGLHISDAHQCEECHDIGHSVISHCVKCHTLSNTETALCKYWFEKFLKTKIENKKLREKYESVKTE